MSNICLADSVDKQLRRQEQMEDAGLPCEACGLAAGASRVYDLVVTVPLGYLCDACLNVLVQSLTLGS